MPRRSSPGERRRTGLRSTPPHPGSPMPILLAIVLCTTRFFAQICAAPATEPQSNLPKLVLAFYYPWYGTPEGTGGGKHGKKLIHWEGVDASAKSVASSTHYPAGGAYDSQDPAVLARHCELASRAGIDGFILSWWGGSSYENEAIQPLLDACAKKGLKLSIYYEQIAKPGAPQSVAAEITDLVRRYGAHPGFLKVHNGEQDRPVVFIYGRALDQFGMKKWRDAVAEIRSGPGAQPLLIADNFGPESLSIFD